MTMAPTRTMTGTNDANANTDTANSISSQSQQQQQLQVKALSSSSSLVTSVSSSSSTTTTTVAVASPRLLAQDAVKWYMEELDPYETHATNIRFLFRPVIMSLTLFILDSYNKNSNNTNNNVATKRSSWMDYLEDAMELNIQASSPSSFNNNINHNSSNGHHISMDKSNEIMKKPQSSTVVPLPTLDRRNLARMEAFLNGIIWSVPSSSSGHSNNSSNNNINNTSMMTTWSRRNQSPRRANSTPQQQQQQHNKQQQQQQHNNKQQQQHSKNNYKTRSLSLLDGLSGFNTAAPTASSLFRSLSTSATVPPHRSGGSGSSSSSSTTNVHGSVMSGDASPRLPADPQHAQIRSLDLEIRLELYLRTLLRVSKACSNTSTSTSTSTSTVLTEQQQKQQEQHPKQQKQESLSRPTNSHCVLSAEPPRALKARVEAIVMAFLETVDTVRQQGPILTKLLTFMTMELLAVPTLSEACQNAIRRVVVDYEHQTSFASLAFLSSPEDAATHKLVPLLHRYFGTLKDNWQGTVRDCELESLLQTVLDPDMRQFFKTVEFASIGHLLETCVTYRPLLQRIEIPPTATALSSSSSWTTHTPNAHGVHDQQQIRQAIRDLQRERITINGHLLPPVKSRSELLRILSHTLDSAMLTTSPATLLKRGNMGGRKGRGSANNSNKGSSIRRSESAPTFSHMQKLTQQQQQQQQQQQPAQRFQDEGVHEELLTTNQDSDPLISSDDLWGDDTISAGLSVANESDDGAGSTVGGGSTVGTGSSTKSRSFDMSTVDMLTRRLLLAASRTGTGGDAYFIVNDLFGGKDVQVLASQDLRGAGGAPTKTLEIWLHLASLTIQCHTSFDVYPRFLPRSSRSGSSSGSSSNINMNGTNGHVTSRSDPYAIVDSCEPLIQLHTTTTEVIALQEVRVADVVCPKQNLPQSNCINDNNHNNNTATNSHTPIKNHENKTDTIEGAGGGGRRNDKESSSCPVSEMETTPQRQEQEPEQQEQQEQHGSPPPPPPPRRRYESDNANTNDGGHYILQERITSQTGWKTLSIRPALYEKLQVWTTPS